MKKSLKTIIIIGLAISTVALGFKAYAVDRQLQEYKQVYDGLELFEDGSWTYEDDEYYFWNWETEYVKN